MKLSELTDSERILLGSIGASTLLLTAFIVVCIVRKDCWLNRLLWNEDGQAGYCGKKKNSKMEDIICIRYPPDIYPGAIGLYRESILKTPDDDEMARLFVCGGGAAAKRDSTYSSMSETSSGSYESPHFTTSSSNSQATSPVHVHRNSNNFLHSNQHSNEGSRRSSRGTHGRNSSVCVNEGTADTEQRLLQPYFTFGMKYDEGNCLRIDFAESKNLPYREYLNQPSDAFFIIEIVPKNEKPNNIMNSVANQQVKEGKGKTAALSKFRFVTKTIPKAKDICDFSEKFVAKMAKESFKDYVIRFTGYDEDRHGNPTELGSTVFSLEDFYRDFNFGGPENSNNSVLLTCSLNEPVTKRGEIQLGLCYLPTAERMSVTVVKVCGLDQYYTNSSSGLMVKQNVCFVRLLLLRADNGRVLKRKKTTYKKLGHLPSPHTTSKDKDKEGVNLSETLVFDMPPNELKNTLLLALVCVADKSSEEEATINSGGSAIFHYAIDSHNGDKDHSKKKKSNKKAKCHSPTSTTTNISASTTPSPDAETKEGPEEQQKSRKQNILVVGKIALGSGVKSGHVHWENMIKSPRNVVSEWHKLK